MRCWTVVFVVSVCVEYVRSASQDTASRSGGNIAADRGYVAEWQWEQWPQQIPADTGRTPGARMGSSLWFDSSASSWWLFGGRQVPTGGTRSTTKVKIFTDLWRYDTVTRNWSRIFPNDKLKSNVGGMILLRTSLFDDGHVRKTTGTRNPGVVLCGRSEGKRLDERSLAVYGPKSSRSDTVWQLELKDKEWTAYVCCCDNTERSTPAKQESNATRNYGNVRTTDDDNNAGQQTSNNDNTSNNTKKSKDNQQQTSSLDDTVKVDGRKSNYLLSNQEINDKVDNTVLQGNESAALVRDNSTLFGVHNASVRDEPSSESHNALDPGKQCTSDVPGSEHLDFHNASVFNHSDHGEQLADTTPRNMHQRDVRDQQKTAFDATANDSSSNQAFCPDFEVSGNERSKGQPVAWCDTNKELLVALDLKVIPLTLWQFDLKTSHWTQQKVDIEEGTLWPGCSSSIRYASTRSTVYILCPPYGVTNATSTRLVYRIDASHASLQASGQLQLNVLFGNQDGNTKWTDETKTILQTVDTENNKTLLLMAYDKLLDIWVLDRNSDRGYFVPVENIWRGSALKWFRGFDAPFYNLEMAGQSWLLPNPREIMQYWPRERGKFIIRLTDHGEGSSGASPIKEELHTMEIKNHSETGIPILQHHQAQDGIKALVFFAFSLSIFAIFGMAVFVRRCVTCPPQSWPLRGDDGSKTAPPVIRYSVIPDDLAYPVA